MPGVISPKDSAPKTIRSNDSRLPACVSRFRAAGRLPARPAARLRRQAALRRLGLAGCGAAAALGALAVCRLDFRHLVLFLFVSLLAGLAAALPATGPRGQRVGLLPAVGLAALLLLPLSEAWLPLLLANMGYALTRATASARRPAGERGLCLLLALGAGAAVLASAPPAVRLGLTAAVYAAVFALARRVSLLRHAGNREAGRRQARQCWRLEAATLLATAPSALLMALVFPRYGLPGLSGAAALLALLGLVAHFGFEVAGLRGQVQAMERLSAVSVSQTSAPRVTEQFLHLSRGLVSCDRAALWLTDEMDMRLKRVGLRGEAEETVSVRFGEGLAGRAAERQVPLMVRDAGRDPRAVAQENGGRDCAVLLLPLVAGSRTLGVAQFERDAPGTFTHRDSVRLLALASQAAATLANIRAHQDVYSQAVTDALTGLFNRRHMQTVLADERRRAERYGHPLSVIMLDVDGFKSYNDTYGHVQGDVLLRMLAEILGRTVRRVDIVGRFGGEEFLVVLPETPPDEAYQAAERLRLAVAGALFPGFADDPEMTVGKTVSLGVATYPDITQDTQALVTLADSALYRAKRSGRNRTVQAGPEPVAPS